MGNSGMMMRLWFAALSAPLLAMSIFAQADEDGQGSRYVAEAPLPRGWPVPGAAGVVTVKEFPAYRAAYTEGWSSSFAFWRLFSHIKRQNIPMTAPVEMGMGQRGDNGQRLGMDSMGFLYQHDQVGKTGQDGAKVRIKDMPAMKALSYIWQGPKNRASLARAKQALDEALQKGGWQSKDYRVLGYNGPGTPDAKKTWEMLLVLPAPQADQP